MAQSLIRNFCIVAHIDHGKSTLADRFLDLTHALNDRQVPVLNKIDLPAADPDEVGREVAELVGCDPGDVLRVSAKSGEGVPQLLDAVVARVPPPRGDPSAPLRALIFDSSYDPYRGVVAY